MIKEKIGMRVRAIKEDESLDIHVGDEGKITQVDGDGCPGVSFDNGNDCFMLIKELTEIKEDNMYLDEALKVIREDSDMEMSWGNKINWYSSKELDGVLGDIGATFLMGSEFGVRVKKPTIKEVTMADLEEKYGCKVKVVK